jgi:hypothetical protein
VPLDYLPIMNANKAGAPRAVVSSQQTAWTPAPAQLGSARVALLTSAAVRHVNQPAFERTSDASYRAVPFELLHPRIVAMPLSNLCYTVTRPT